jgi:cell filamentation protein
VQDPHSAPGNLCPLNFFGATEYALLQPFEAAAAYQRTRELEEAGMSGNFGAAHLRLIHRYIFQDIYPWAGELRVVNLSKGGSHFGPAFHIGSALDELLGKLQREDLLINLRPATFAMRAAFYLGEINAIHPFREGNGRTQREFVRQLAVQAGHPLSWSVVGTGFTQQQMVDASILSHMRGDNTGLAAIIEAALLSTRANTDL